MQKEDDIGEWLEQKKIEAERKKKKDAVRRPKVKIDKQKLLQLWKEGFSRRKIAEKLNISLGTAVKKLKELQKQQTP